MIATYGTWIRARCFCNVLCTVHSRRAHLNRRARSCQNAGMAINFNTQHWDKATVAAYLGYSVRTIDRMDADRSSRRTFPEPRRIKGRKRWLRTDVERWAADQ